MGTQAVFRYSHTVGFLTIRGRGFFRPVAMAQGRDGLLYVISRGVSEAEPFKYFKRVTICTVDEEYMGEFSTGGSGDGELLWPSSIAIDRDENIYISDEALHRISIFDNQGQFQAKWGVQGKGDGEFDRPAGIAFDKDDNLLVVDGLNNRVQRFTKEGQFLGGWGRAGRGDGEFSMPWGITVDEAGDAYVADWRNDRIQKFDADGNHLASWGTSGQGDGEFNRPSGVAVDQEGNVYVADWGNDLIQVLGPDGSFLAKFRGESGLSTWAENWFAASQPDLLEQRQRSDMEPEFESLPDDFLREGPAAIEKLFWAPTSVMVDAQGRVCVVDTCRHRIQVYLKES